MTPADEELAKRLLRLHKIGGRKSFGTALLGFGLDLYDRWYGPLCYRLGNWCIRKELERMKR